MNEKSTLLRTPNFSDFFLSCFLSLLQYDMVQTVAEKCLKFSYLLLEKC